MIAAAGRLKDGGERELFDRYAKRFDQSGRSLALGPLVSAEVPESRFASTALRKADEAARLLKASAGYQQVIALDENGQQFTSAAFAGRLAQMRDDGCASLAFLIGGPDGHGAGVLGSARLQLAFGPMTLPHGLARVVLTEQLYRAATILSNSSGQITFLAPTVLAAGQAGLVATGTDGKVTYGSVPVGTVAPALFAVSMSGQFIELYGTGFRGRSSLAAVTCTISGVQVPVLYAGPQGDYPGLDQINVRIPRTRIGGGAVSVIVSIAGKSANVTMVSIK